MSTDRPSTGGGDVGDSPPAQHPPPEQYPPPAAPPGWGGPPPPSGQPTWGQYPPPPAHWTATPPPPLSGRPPTATGASTRGQGWVIALILVSGVMLLGLVAVVVVPWLAALPTARGGPIVAPPPAASTSSPTPSTSTTPEPKPGPTMPTSADDLLKKNPIYALAVPAKCPAQRVPAGQTAFRKQVQRLVDCQNAAWKKALARTPVTFSKPKVKFYASSIKTPCGKLGTRFPASYCTSNRTLYFSKAAYQQGRYFRLSVAHFVIHEYAHHVQELAEIFGSIWWMDRSRAEISRRLELQAHCMAHYGITHSGLGFNAGDRRDADFQFDYTNDAKGHGSTKAERYWGERGLKAKTIGSCNTWKAKASRVK